MVTILFWWLAPKTKCPPLSFAAAALVTIITIGLWFESLGILPTRRVESTANFNTVGWVMLTKDPVPIDVRAVTANSHNFQQIQFCSENLREQTVVVDTLAYPTLSWEKGDEVYVISIPGFIDKGVSGIDHITTYVVIDHRKPETN